VNSTGTVHLFIDTWRSLYEFTFISLITGYNHDTDYHGPIGLCIFKSVQPFVSRRVIMPKLPGWQLRRCFCVDLPKMLLLSGPSTTKQTPNSSYMPPCQKYFYSSMVYTFLNLLDLISLLCLRHPCRCPLTITLLSFGVLSSFVIKLLPFEYIYSIGIDMLYLLDFFPCPYPLIQILNPKNSIAYLNISVYMSMTFLSFETLSYSIVKSLSFGNLYSLRLGMPVPLESCILLFLYVLTFISQYLFKTFQLTCP
jgi:hypothetical protein